ncbi:Serine hydroxymethyltransferase [Candidatus Norongarragalina meridionalis]|nr:Serine hydroxymethyltransferase [Candidatus Norongarragalina meridionalis]
MIDLLKEADPEVYSVIQQELHRQMNVLEMIPSENLVSEPVLEAMGSVFTNKYSEGYPHKRYYGGNEFTDIVEEIAINRAKQLFGAEHVNVQPYSGSPANIAVYFALLQFGDKVMGMSLAEGGHLTHGHAVNFSGRAYKFVQYGVSREDERIDYDAMRKTALAEKPKIIVSGATAYSREIDFKQIHEIAQECGAISMTDIAHIAGLIVAGVHQSPFPFTEVVTTTTHKTLRGPRGGMIMCKEQYGQAIDKAVFPGLQGGPHEHTIAAKAVCFGEALKPEFKTYGKQIVKNAKALADALQAGGLRLVTGGTDNHLLLVDLSDKGVSGKEAEIALDKANITVNKNMIPFDKRKPFDPSGIRLGTPVLTTRGMKESEMKEVGRLIVKAVGKWNDEAMLANVKAEVIDLCKDFQFYR